MTAVEDSHAGGLGVPAARWAICFAWLTGVAHGLIAHPAEAWHPATLCGYALVLVAVLLITTRSAHRLERSQLFWLFACALAAGAIAVLRFPLTGENWLFNFSSYMFALAIPRGNARSGIAGCLLFVVGGAVWTFAHGAPSDVGVAFLTPPITAFLAGSVWGAVLVRVARRERGHAAAVRATRMQQFADEELTRDLRDDLDQIAAEVVPVLTRIADGEVIDEALIIELQVREGAVRDRIRSPNLAHPRVREAIAKARGRGTVVLLLGEGKSAHPLVNDAMARELVQALEDVSCTEVTIRALPGRAAISLLLVRESGTERIVLVNEALEAGMVKPTAHGAPASPW